MHYATMNYRLEFELLPVAPAAFALLLLLAAFKEKLLSRFCSLEDGGSKVVCGCDGDDCKFCIGLLGAVLEFELVLLVVLEFGLVIVELESLEKMESCSGGVGGTVLVETA